METKDKAKFIDGMAKRFFNDFQSIINEYGLTDAIIALGDIVSTVVINTTQNIDNAHSMVEYFAKGVDATIDGYYENSMNDGGNKPS